jgi:RNA polymerase sigma-70 factor (ECF subfamily)
MVDIDALIERWQAGDQRAAEIIYQQHRDSTFGLAYTLLDNSADAEEVAQDALTYALTHIHRFDSQKSRFTTWLHTITVSRCRNKRRRRYLPGLSLFTWRKQGGDAVDPALCPEENIVQEANRDEIWEAIQILKHTHREAILLRYWADYTYQEIADILGCSMRTAQSRVRSGHKQLRVILAQQGWIEAKEKIQ